VIEVARLPGCPVVTVQPDGTRRIERSTEQLSNRAIGASVTR
jgi:hypothetical protein